MVLGLGSKKKGTTVKVEFQIHVQEIKPWKAAPGGIPLLLQWQRGDNRSGKTRSVVPSQEDGGKLVFNDSFRLPAKLIREPEGKGRNAGLGKFQKKTVVFILQQATTEVQVARCVLDLAEYGDIDSKVPANIPLAVGKKFASAAGTPSLFLSVGPYQKDERSFASRLSFGSSTPRNSILRAPEKAVITSKSKVEPALDDDTRKSIVAALMSDDDDEVSLESFTDDEDSPEGSTPRSETTAKSSVSETSNSKSTTPPAAEIIKPSTSRQETPNSVNNSSPSSQQSGKPSDWKFSTSLPALETPRPSTSGQETPTSGHKSNPSFQSSTTGSSLSQEFSHGRPTQLTDDPLLSPTFLTEDRPVKPRPIPSKHGLGKARQGPVTLPEERGDGPLTPSSSTASVTQLFSTVPIHKATNLIPESGGNASKELAQSPGPSSESGSEASKVTKPPEEREGTSHAALVSAENQISSSKASKSPTTSPQGVPKLTDMNGSTFLQSKTPRETVETEPTQLSKDDAPAEKGRSPRIIPPLPPASAKAAAAAAATAYVARRTFRSSRGSSFDYSYESSEDSLSESSKGEGSPPGTPLHNKSHSTELPGSSSQETADAKRNYNKQVEGKVEDKSTASELSVSSPPGTLGAKQSVNKQIDGGKVENTTTVQKDEKQDGTKSVDSRSLNVKKSAEVGSDVRKDAHLREKVVEDENGEQAEGSVLGSARANMAKVEKKALDELRNKIANAEARFLAETQKVAKLEGELRDSGAMEVALYCVVAEHGNSSHKLHTPARRLARLYMHACKYWSPERRAGTAKNCVSGLVTVAKSCGTDVSRLTFWWSNIVVLRTVITQAFDAGSSGAPQTESVETNSTSSSNGSASTGWARARRSLRIRSNFTRQITKPLSPKPPSSDWQECSTFTAALERIEEWIYSKIIESLWWQAMMPRMQKTLDASSPTSPRGMSLLSPSALLGSEFANKAKDDLSKLAGDVSSIFIKKIERGSVSLPELGDARQGNMSVEIWKKAIMEAFRRLCPVRGAGHDCGCLPMLIRMAVEGCVARLDIALFNGILREPGEDVPTDPLSDPVSDPSVLPLSPGGLTFGGGSQLKNVVVTWSTFISSLVSVKEPVFVPVDEGDNLENSEDSEKASKFFTLIKATGDLLMLPKDILMDRAIRKEICPMLSLPLIRRILENFVPDEFAPDPISPSLLAALNAEATIEKQRQGEADDISSSVPMAAAPPVTYVAPSAYYVWSWIGEVSLDPTAWGRSNNSLLRKGYTSDEDLEIMEKLQKTSASDKLEFLIGASREGSVHSPNGDHPEDSPLKRSPAAFADGSSAASRFQLLKEVWGI